MNQSWVFMCPHPEPPSLFPAHPIPQGCPSALALSFLRTLHTVLYSGCISLHSHPQCKSIPFSQHPLQHLLFVDFLIAVILLNHLFLDVLYLCWFTGFYPVAGSRGYPALHVQASYFSDFSRRHRLNGAELLGSTVSDPRLQSTGSTAVPSALSCSVARGVFLNQGSNLSLLRWEADSLPLSHQGSPQDFSFLIMK